jgi:hypothetical protein
VSAVDLQARVLDRLGAGDDVFAAEASKEKAVDVAGALGIEEAEPKPPTAEERSYAPRSPPGGSPDGVEAKQRPAPIGASTMKSL